ncbi:MAG TPA: peptidoglycan-binding domain-containing protein [Candidatus Paceibacterota bacterium]
MNKYIKIIAIIALFVALSGASYVMAQTTNGGDDVVSGETSNSTMTNGSDDASQSNPTVNNGGDDVGGGQVGPADSSQTGSNPAVTNGGDDVGGGSVGSGDTSGTGSNPTVNNGGDDVAGGNNNSNMNNGGDDDMTGGGTGSTGTTGSNDNTSTGGSTSGGSRRTGGVRGDSNLVILSTTPILVGNANCVYLNDYLKIGRANPSSEVIKLQLFLRDIEKLDVSPTGIFDQKTFDAVSVFQVKPEYIDDIMKPWGVTTPTGQVWYTTKKKINEIYCKTNFSLTAEQLAQIEAYRKGLEDGTITVDADGNIINSTGTPITLPEVGLDDNDSQTAAVGSTSFGARMWSFIKWLFGY